jgi:hypothetical protein
MHIFYWVVGVLSLAWLLIWVDLKRTKAQEFDEGWEPNGKGFVKKLWKDLPPIEEHEECFHVVEDQNN